MYTLENCEKLWEEAVGNGTVEERIACTKRWEPYYSFLAENMKEAPVSEPPFVTHLAQEGILTPDTSVLDIGAGMGTYALPFAKRCREVTALEPAGACLEVLNRRAKTQGVTNIRTVHGFWEQYSPDGDFDVTFASMCPAVCNTEELHRMEEMTNRTCCLVSVQRGSYDKHRKAMMAALGVKPRGGMTTEAIHYINALYLMGRQPNVTFRETRQVTPVSWETARKQYPIYFAIFGISPADSLPFLEKYFAENAVSGVLQEESYLRQALIYWDKK